MSSILYKKQHKDGEKPIYDPDEFKKMIKKEKPILQEFLISLLPVRTLRRKAL
jgi:hypothetical protein